MQSKSGTSNVHYLHNVPRPFLEDAVSSIGYRLEEARQALISASHRIEVICDQGSALLARDARLVLERQAVRITVIGQIKAGKTTFINAFLRNPRLLPVDVVPCTTAVTNLMLAHERVGPYIARFNFFGPDEWSRLSETGGTLHELAERLVPGFESDLVRSQLQFLKNRVEQRFGPELGELLGVVHRFKEVDRSILQQYICAEGVDENESVGRFSDIVRSADIFLSDSPMSFPTILTDTPGTNDPFLVRDEITRRHLDDADIYIVVLTVHSGLSLQDLSLFRMLRSLHKDRIIIYVNRADELDDPAHDVCAIVDRVKELVALEFPGARIPVIGGSAEWALISVDPARRTALTADAGTKAAAFCERQDLMSRSEVLRLVNRPDMAEHTLGALFFAASGIPAVYAALEGMLLASNPAFVLRQTGRCFQQLVGFVQGRLELEFRNATALRDEMLETGEQASHHIELLEAELFGVTTKIREIEGCFSIYQARIEDELTTGLSELRSQLYEMVNLYAEQQKASFLLEAAASRRSAKAWVMDTSALRQELGLAVVSVFERIERKIAAETNEFYREFGRIASSVLNWDFFRSPESSFDHLPPPSFRGLGATLAIDLDISWWGRVLGGRRDLDASADRVARLVQSEFYPVVSDLAGALDDTTHSHVDFLKSWSAATVRQVVSVLEKRKASLEELRNGISSKLVGAADVESLEKQSRRIDVIRSRLSEAKDLSGSLERSLYLLEQSSITTRSPSSILG